MKIIIAVLLALILYQLENIQTEIHQQTVYMQEGDVHETDHAAVAIAHDAAKRLAAASK